ncbi:hypothetical protein HELRODRAFT_78768, partial [Helobdella robusta]|uniref:Uncharacterized protein n=1 Tax=Helobdella robusta TaxID=6412 RepID=T1G3F5_HELRO
YVSQQAWIQNCTVRENICLNRPFVQKKYEKVVSACHLADDLKKFPGGDLSELGSKGANLSGGQRQRVNLARAVYSKADLYLIDDSLSAVDPQVAKHIFKEVISREGLLRKKTRIFATNSIGFLPEMDLIIVMNSGAIECIGTYGDIMKHKGDYFTFLQQHADSIREESADRVAKRSLSIGPGSITPFREEGLNAGLARLCITQKSLTNLENEKMIESNMHYDVDEWQPNTFTATTSQINVEKVDSGQIRWGAIGDYIKSGGLLIFMIVLIGHLAMLMSQCASYIWIQRWTDNITNETLDQYVTSYGVIGLVEVISIIIISLMMAFGFSSASKALHDKAIKRLFRAPISYFDTTSPGQIFNYMSTDLDTVDCALPLDVQLWLISFCVIISSIGTIAYADPIYLCITLPIMLVSAIVQRIYGRSAIQLRREYALKKTPVYSHFEESISGAVSIRSYGKQKLFMSKADRLNDESHKPWHSYLACWRWYTLYNETMGVLAIFLTAITAVIVENEKFPGRVALALFSIFQILPHIPIATRMMIEIEAHIVAVERLMKCASIPQEAPRQSAKGHEPPESWPTEGHIEFKDLCVKYRPDLKDDCLKNLNFDIVPKSKVGVVGETGAGKSSIIISLFRMMEARAGSISIDNRNIANVGLHELRSKLTCIPQEPILFSGTLRSNLDALRNHTDQQIWNSLVQAQLEDFIKKNMAAGLDHVINSEDEVCVGRRQQICLARALLRNSKIILLDEPTAAVDYRTDQTIQEVIRKEFNESTIVTVAHRLATVKDCDKILVLDFGQVVEYEAPEKLLANPNSKFSQMNNAAKMEQM